MKTKLLFILVMGLMVIGMSSCKKATYLNVDKEKITFSSDGGEQVLKLSSDVPTYEIECFCDWLTCKLDGDNLIITAKKNDTGTPRDYEIRIYCDFQRMKVFFPIHQE